MKPGDDLSYYLGPAAVQATAAQCRELRKTFKQAPSVVRRDGTRSPELTGRGAKAVRGTMSGDLGRELREGYYRLRRSSSIVRDADSRFVGKRWEDHGQVLLRRAEGWELRVYKVEGDIEACLISPNGSSRTYS